MNNFNINFDRPKPTSEEIKQRQNFDEVLTTFNQAQAPVYKNPWFWGSAGLASVGVATMLTLNAFSKTNADDDKTTLKTVQNLPPDTECVKPPVKEETPVYQVYTVNPQKEETIVLPSGSTIEIPKGALEASNPSKDVEIKVREFHDQTTVFLAGIPMDYKKSAFESAGMIEIRGEQDGNTVEINPEKPIEVKLNLHTSPSGFDFWSLNDQSGEWTKYPATYTQKTEAVASKNTQIPALKKEIERIDAKLLTVQSEQDQLQKPSKDEYKIPGVSKQHFDVDFDGKDFPELEAYRNLEFEITSHNGNDPTFEVNSQKTWHSMNLSKVKENSYKVTFVNAREKYEVLVRPVLKGKELKLAQAEFDQAIAKHERVQSELEAKKKALLNQQQANQQKMNALIQKQLEENQRLTRKEFQETAEISEQARKVNESYSSVAGFAGTANFQVNKWGIFNCDKPKTYPKALKNEVLFTFASGVVAKIRNLFVFNLDKKNRYTYGEGAMSMNEFGLEKNDQYVLVGIDQEGAICFAELKKDVNLEQLSEIRFVKKQQNESTFALLSKLLDENPALS